jgi:hypothetical protein
MKGSAMAVPAANEPHGPYLTVELVRAIEEAFETSPLRISTLPPCRFEVKVLLNSGTGMLDPYNPATAALVHEVTFVVDACDAVAACELVYGICNSTPQQMRVDERYLRGVEGYRAQGRRSLSVGDVLVLRSPIGARGSAGEVAVEAAVEAADAVAFACDRVGFKLLPQVPVAATLTVCRQCGATVPADKPSYRHDDRCAWYPPRSW